MDEGASRARSSGPGRHGRTRGEERRREILEAAERVFGRAGYWNATTSEIAREVGVSQPAVYRYFPSKRELFREAVALRQQELEQSARTALESADSGRDRILAVARATIRLALERPHMAMLRVQAMAVAAEDEEIGERVRAALDRLFALHESLLRQGIADGSIGGHVDARAVARAISGQAFLLYVTIATGHPLATAEAAEQAIEGLLESLTPEA